MFFFESLNGGSAIRMLILTGLFLCALYTNAFDKRRYILFYFIYLFFPWGGAILGFSLANLEVRLPKVKFFLKIKSQKSLHSSFKQHRIQLRFRGYMK